MHAAHRELVNIEVDGGTVEGLLALPVLFAHGSGSSRASPRNNAVAGALRKAGLGTLLMDLLSASEDHDTAKRFDIDLLSARLALAAHWLAAQPATKALPLGLFGASTGDASALRLAAAQAQRVRAVVARGGRPDLAGRATLAAVRVPTLLLVGALDQDVLALNRAAAALMRCECCVEVIDGASHLFEEPGRLALVAQGAARWFGKHLCPSGA